MATINQLVSTIAHSLRQPDSLPVKRAIKLGIINARNELIRKSYSNHNYTDKILQQRFRLELIDIEDGDIYEGETNLIDNVNEIKRTKNKVPRPVRLTNNLPFHSIRTSGVYNPVEIAYVKEASSKYYKSLPGFCPKITYDYINEYIYINTLNAIEFNNLNYITVESVFEYPHIIPIETNESFFNIDNISDDDEFLIPEDMIGDIKKIILETFNPQVMRDTNEVHPVNLVS